MDKRFVDPRRPMGTPTEAQKAEMLPPYNEELGYAPQLFATHKETVERLQGVPLRRPTLLCFSQNSFLLPWQRTALGVLL